MRFPPLLAFATSLFCFLPPTLTATETPPADTPPPPVFISAARLAVLRERVLAGTEPTASAWLPLRALADEALAYEPRLPRDGHYRVPGFYRDAAAHRAAKDGLRRDANAAYALALAARVSGRDDYAEAAARLALAWTSVRRISPEADSTLTFAYHFPAMIFAADLLRGTAAWTTEHEARFRDYLALVKTEAERRGRDRWLVWTRDNNWGNWGNVLGLATAAFLDDQALFDAMVARWKRLTEISIAADGHLPHEVSRNRDTPGSHGLWYSHFTLQPHTLGAEIARHRGVDLFNHVSPSGRSLRLAYERLVPWVADPDSFPYFTGPDKSLLHLPHAISYWELLEPRWPREEARALILPRRPLDSQHSSPFTTFTHGDLPADL